MKKVLISLFLVSSLLSHAAAEQDYSRVSACLRPKEALDTAPKICTMEQKKQDARWNSLIPIFGPIVRHPRQSSEMRNLQIAANPFLIAQGKVVAERGRKQEQMGLSKGIAVLPLSQDGQQE